MEYPFCLHLLGPVQIKRHGEILTGQKSRKVLALLGYLSSQSQPVSRSYLVNLFWPDNSENRGRNNLSQVLHNITTFWPDCLRSDRYSIQFRHTTTAWVDVNAFNELVAKGEPASLAAAADLYQGDFMAGMYLDDCPEFEQWLRLEQETWRRRVGQVLQELVTCYRKQQDLDQALLFVSRLLAIDPWLEEAHRCKMLLLAQSKQRSAALAQYELCRELLSAELGVEPEAETMALYDKIRSGNILLLPMEGENSDRLLLPVRPPYPHPVVSYNNLPAQTTSFIGREDELAMLAGYLDQSGCRLLTIVGLGGIGKTRLALQTAATAAGKFQHGVCFVPLAAVSSPDFIIATIADRLKFPLYGQGDPKTQLLNHLSGKEMLLVMDNFEHLLSGANLLVEILENAAQIKVLVTARERLRLHEEWVLDLQGLSFPENDETGDIQNYSAVRLFLERAQQARAGVQLGESEIPAVTHICRLVEGMPLGIELAAAWTRTLSCATITGEIEKNYNFLTTSFLNVPKRHQSLRAIFEHSWKLMAEEERKVFRKLSVFRGGFTRQAAEQVVGASTVLLSALIDKSLLHRTPADRYQMHELLRQYGTEKLAEVPSDREKVQSRHCKFYAAFLQEQGIRLKGKKQKDALEAISLEIDNIRAGWSWAIMRREEREIGQYLEVLFLFHNMQSWFQEGEVLFRQAAANLPRPEYLIPGTNGKADKIRGQIRARQGVFCASLGRYDEAQEILTEGQAIFQEARLRQTSPLSLNYLGAIAWALGYYPMAKSLCQESLALIKESGDRWKEALCFEYLGMIAISLGEYREAKDLAQQSLKIFREFNYSSGIAFSLNLMGIAARNLGQFAEAKGLCQESLAISRKIGDRWEEALSLEYLSMVAVSRGEYWQARDLAQQSLKIFREFKYSSGIAFSLNLVGIAARNLGQLAEAQRVHQEVLQTCQELDYQLGIALASYYLGHTHFLLGDHDEARRLLKESLAISKKLAYQRGVTRSLNTLGSLACAEGHYREAERYLCQALELTREIQAVPMVLDILTGLASLLRQEGHAERAIELLTVSINHSATEKETRDRANRLLAEMMAEFPEPLLSKFHRGGKGVKLDEVVSRMLQEKAARIAIIC